MWIRVLEICLSGLALCLIRRFVRRKRAPLPPGPPGWPLVGNLFDVPADAPHKTMGAMSQKYGPFVSLNLMGTQYLVVNSAKVANDLLEKQSAIMSGRPHYTMGCDLVGWANSSVLVPYGNMHRRHRKFFYQQIGSKSSLQAFYQIEETEAKKFLCRVLEKPDNVIAQSHRMTSTVSLRISYGYAIQGQDDPLLEMATNTIENFSVVTTPGRFLVDMLPILRYLPEWFPGCGFLKDARQWRKTLMEAVNTPYEFVLDQLARGDATPSLVSRQLQEGVSPDDAMVLKWASFSMYLGGAETTPSALSAFFLAMTIYPEVQKKAQAEVDAVVGHERLPTIEDRDKLPYVNAVCKELLRWHVVSPFIVRVSTEDTMYEGYSIPKGTYILLNLWFMLSNSETYPNPEIFDPSRFLGDDPQPDPREVYFGWGRRSCPGALLAELTIFTCVSMAYATLDVSRHVENGVECIPRYDATEGVIRRVKPFKYRITSRSVQAEDLLRNIDSSA